MKITERYFASIREAIGTGLEPVQTSDATLGAVRDELIARGGPHADSLARGVAAQVFKPGNHGTTFDDGPGMGMVADPFAPFAKGEASVGSGLGLDIVRRLCAAAGIDLTSGAGANGKGACFTLKFLDR